MKQALYFTLEKAGPNGYRIVEVAEQAFPVVDAFVWVQCEDHIVADQYYYDPEDQTIKPLDNAPTIGVQTL